MSNGTGPGNPGSPLAKPIAAPPQNVSFSVERLLSSNKQPPQLHPNHLQNMQHLQNLHQLHQQQQQLIHPHPSPLHSLTSLSQSHPSPTSSEGSAATTPTPINSAGKISVSSSGNSPISLPPFQRNLIPTSYNPYREILNDTQSRSNSSRHHHHHGDSD
jgi:hypothetical protein